MLYTDLSHYLGNTLAWVLGAGFIMFGMWVKALLEWCLWDVKTDAWVEKYFKDWHYLKFLYWVGLYSGARFLIPHYLIYDISLLFFQWGAFENGANFASMSMPYEPYDKNGIGFFGLKNPKALIVCAASFVLPFVYNATVTLFRL